MAITKETVKAAYKALVAKGENPSIDAIRIALGKTGSKSTIHRYRKEIIEESKGLLEDEALLSSSLKKAVSGLAGQLQSEALEVVTLATQRHNLECEELKRISNDQVAEITSMGSQIDGLSKQGLEKSVLIQSLQNDLSDANTEIKRQREKITGQKDILDEKNSRVLSLEEQHKHGRQSLEHYRQSVLTQKEQDRRDHQQQVQQLQTELRHLKESLVMKQSEITQISSEGSRLTATLEAARESAAILDDKFLQSVEANQKADALLVKRDMELSSSRSLSQMDQDTISYLKSVGDQLKTSHNSQMAEIIRLKTELSVKEELYSKISIVAENVEEIAPIITQP